MSQYSLILLILAIRIGLFAITPPCLSALKYRGFSAVVEPQPQRSVRTRLDTNARISQVPRNYYQHNAVAVSRPIFVSSR